MEMGLAEGQGHEENKWGQSLQSFTEQIFRCHNSRKARFPAIPVIGYTKQTILYTKNCIKLPNSPIIDRRIYVQHGRNEPCVPLPDCALLAVLCGINLSSLELSPRFLCFSYAMHTKIGEFRLPFPSCLSPKTLKDWVIPQTSLKAKNWDWERFVPPCGVAVPGGWCCSPDHRCRRMGPGKGRDGAAPL